MLSQERRLRTRDITRLFARSTTQKIAVYPFVYFVWVKTTRKKSQQNESTSDLELKTPSSHIQRGIQLPNKLLKTAVQRHFIKRIFYACVDQLGLDKWDWCILAVPQKKWSEDLTQILATANKTHILETQKQVFLKSLSLFSKKLWDLKSE